MTKNDERNRSFNSYRIASSDNAKEIVAEAVRLLQNYEHDEKQATSRQGTFDLTVDAILSDLMPHHLVDSPREFMSPAPQGLGDEETV